MMRNCDVCGTEYQAKRPSSKYCSARCRQRSARSPGVAPVVTLDPPAPVDDMDGPREFGPIGMATRTELEAVGQAETALGALALMLARRLDGISMDTGSSVAAIVREHKRTLAEAINAGTAEADPLDQLAKRRQERRARA